MWSKIFNLIISNLFAIYYPTYLIISNYFRGPLKKCPHQNNKKTKRKQIWTETEKFWKSKIDALFDADTCATSSD